MGHDHTVRIGQKSDISQRHDQTGEMIQFDTGRTHGDPHGHAGLTQLGSAKPVIQTGAP
ncbi:hypothetical protein [Asaia platycodi]|uniref:hypothetical protein n=1 Tax=Asaia platycodi TaxID=610243 RepID=UPI00131ED25B|nr:hypothetical protein [Asaia platycodi]